MEQLTWPRGSRGHAFSTISTSDYGESDHSHFRRDLPRPRLHQAEVSAHGGKGGLHRHISDHLHGHYLELASVHGVEQLAFGPRRPAFNFQDKGPGRTQSSSSFRGRESRKEEASCSSCEHHADSKIGKASFMFAPSTPLRQDSRTYITASASGMRFSRATNQTHGAGNFAILPDDILLRIMGCFSWKDLWSASLVCRSWCQSLAPLREAMHFVHWGKRFKHGRGGIVRNMDKALHSFLNGAKRGCTAAMVDAGLLLWEMGKKQEGLYWYKRAAQLGDPAGQCNLGLAFLQDASNPTEAVKWFQRAAVAGHVRAQYSLALCLQQGRGIDCSIIKAARWYQRAADGGSARAMYNLALCYRKGEGLITDSHSARKWMKRAALAGHRKAQFEHGLTLFAENDGGLALVFLELATRAGETAAIHLRDALMQQLSPKTRTHAISCADKWQAKLSART